MANENLKTLEDKLSYAYDTKIAIHDAIVAKGVDIPEGTVFRDYAGKIGEIESGGGFTGTATVTFVAPYGYNAREISYIDENYELVTSTDESVQIPIPQIAYIEFGGGRESAFSSSGDCSGIYHSLMRAAYYIYGNTTFTASM